MKFKRIQEVLEFNKMQLSKDQEGEQAKSKNYAGVSLPPEEQKIMLQVDAYDSASRLTVKTSLHKKVKGEQASMLPFNFVDQFRMVMNNQMLLNIEKESKDKVFKQM